MKPHYDYLVVGAGIIGMTVVYELRRRYPDRTIAVVEKEPDVAYHASGRNSGVLHAGFYYTADSLKARFTVEGNRRMKRFCKEHGIAINETRKLVVARDENELESLAELQRRAERNGVDTRLIDEEEARSIEPNVQTYRQALYSPTTASVDPKKVCHVLKRYLIGEGVHFLFNTPFESVSFSYDHLINTAGAYADKIAHAHGVGKHYTLLPFKGIYLKYNGATPPIRTNIYPVPNLRNPFLGVHFTVTADNAVKIGPTAIPAFWRENYKGMRGFNLFEMIEILYYEAKLFALNAFHFRELAVSEIKNYNPRIFIQKAKRMVRRLDHDFRPLPAGIRAQLLDRRTNELVQDFIVEHAPGSTHVLNAVSPAFTCSFAFAEYIVDSIEQYEGTHDGK